MLGEEAASQPRFRAPAELTLPTRAFEQLEVMGLSQKYKFAKSVTFDDVVVTFYDLYGLQKLVEDSMDKIWNLNEGLQTEYKDRAIFVLLDGEGIPAAKFTMENAWPKKQTHSQLSMSSNDFKLLTVTFAYDWYTFKESTGVMDGRPVY